MNPEKLTIKAQEAVAAAQKLAESQGQQQIEPEHLLLALLGQSEGIVVPILQKLGADPATITAELNEAVTSLPKVSGAPDQQAYISSGLKQLLDSGAAIANQLKDDFVSTEHLLLAAARVDGSAQLILKRNGVTEDRLLAALAEVRGSQRVTEQSPEAKFQPLEQYGRDLTEEA